MNEEAEKAWGNYRSATYPTLVGAGPAECIRILKSTFIKGFEVGRVSGEDWVCPVCDGGPPGNECSCTCPGGPPYKIRPPEAVLPTQAELPIPMQLDCPRCHARHIDTGEFAYLPHSTHACQNCGLVWKPAKVNTVGVEFLPGYKN